MKCVEAWHLCMDELPWLTAGLSMSPVGLRSYKWNCRGSIGARPIEHKTRHIISQLWYRNFAQKTKLS